MTVSMTVVKTDGTHIPAESVLSFTFKKDAYIPYTTLNARAAVRAEGLADAAEILFTANGRLIHHGLIDKLRYEKSRGVYMLSVSSRGFTSLLCQNQIAPGLKTGISFNALMDGFCHMPYVEHEDNSYDGSYIYVRANTSMWDAAANLSYKLCGSYPYIRGTNKVMMNQVPDPASFSVDSGSIITLGSELAFSRLTSNFHMANMGGDYSEYELNDEDVLARKIVRHKYFELDMRFLRDNEMATEYRDRFDSRGWKRLYCSYSGYNGEDLSDRISFGEVSAERIGSLEIRGSSKGIITETGVYRDKFPRS